MKRNPKRRKGSVSPASAGQYLICASCGNGYESRATANGGGRPSFYCSDRCRLRAWRTRNQ